MASQLPAAPWQVATRYLTLGIILCGLFMNMWLINRLAGRFDEVREGQLSIQRDLLVVQGNQATMLANLDNDARRLINVEERVGRAGEDRQQMREVDQQLTDALIRLRAGLDEMRDRIGPTGPRTREHR